MTADEILALGFGHIPDLLRAHAQREPTRIALIDGDCSLSFAALDAAMDRLAASLQRDGLVGGDVVAVCARASIDYAVIYLGALRAGLTVAPLPSTATAASLALMLDDCGARCLFVDDDAVRLLPLTSGGPRRVAINGGRAAQPLAEWVAPAASVPLPVQVEPQRAFNIIYSSGTTGAPKGIVQPYAMRWVHVQRSAVYGYGPDSVTLLSTPLYSNTTLVSFFPAIAMGGCVVLMAKFDVQRYLQLAERHRVTHTMLVPVQYQRLMDDPRFDGFDLSSFRCKFCTSAPFSAALKADILMRWPGGLVEYYGMTEGGGTCILEAHAHPDKLHTVGRPGPGHDIRLIDEAGREVAPGGSGEVVGRSGAMMLGYHHLAQQTVAAEWHDGEGRRYIRTGDLGRFDGEGFLTLLDRKKDMIISGGFNIYPSDLERLLMSHPEVADCAVVGVASQRWGETPVALVVLADGAAADAAGLLAWANARLGKTQRLAALQISAELPRNAIGKVLKRELREAWRAPVA